MVTAPRAAPPKKHIARFMIRPSLEVVTAYAGPTDSCGPWPSRSTRTAPPGPRARSAERLGWASVLFLLPGRRDALQGPGHADVLQFVAAVAHQFLHGRVDEAFEPVTEPDLLRPAVVGVERVEEHLLDDVRDREPPADFPLRLVAPLQP